jgi:hypothetical protein
MLSFELGDRGQFSMDAAVKRSERLVPDISQPEPHEAIRQRASEIYERSGRKAGHDIQNWVQAESEIQREHEARSAPKAAVVVNVEGVRYVGEYTLSSADGYAPGEFASGDPVPVRIDGDRMYVKRPNGRELETQIIERTG